jgi:hypothetical protein
MKGKGGEMREAPADYMKKAARFLRPLGYTLIRNATTLEEGVLGEATGRFTAADPAFAMTVRIAKGMAPASEFAVLCHELAHVILEHPCHTEADAVLETLRRVRYLDKGFKENVHSEMACELAVIFAHKILGLPVSSRHRRYIERRMVASGENPGDADFKAARFAAGKICEVMA